MSGSPIIAGRPGGAVLPSSAAAAGLPRYNPTAQALHWLTSLLVLAVLPLAWVAVSLPPTPAKGTMFTLHKSVGLTILAIVAARIVWRALHPAPPDPNTPRALLLLARVNHWLLYLVFLVMPISGYLLSAWSGRATSYFGLFTIPGLPQNEAAQRTAEAVHLLGQWAVYAVVLLHLAGTAWHLVVRRDGLLARMLPVQDGRGAH